MADHQAEKRSVIDPGKIESLCSCGQEHPLPPIKLYSGEDAYSILAEDCVKAVGRNGVLIIADENTYPAAGEEIEKHFAQKFLKYKSVKLPGDPEATDILGERLRDESVGYHLIIAVGAGTINDLGKYVSGKMSVPYWSVPTAASMNGYTSSITAIKVDGVKETLPAPTPQFIYVHPGVIEDAPLKLRQAGFCDMLAKGVSDYDWQTESLLFQGSYCRLPSAIVAETEHLYIDKPEMIRDGDGEAISGLFDGLLLSGMAMSLAGSSAPASGGEHLISHFLDMREGIIGRKPDLHGLQVGAGVVFSAACYRLLASLEEKDLRNVAGDLFQADARNIPSVWGDLAPAVERQFSAKRDQLLAFDNLLPTNWSSLKGLFREVRTPEFNLDLMRRTGFEMTLESLEISRDEFYLAALSARTIRARITVLDIAAHAGVLEAAAQEAISLLS
jgi:glycerol-1-phosphate dehydrogenase [NAD(P)+]